MQRGSAVFSRRVLGWVVAVALLALGLASLAAPVFAQGSIVNNNADQFGLVNDGICSQVYNVAVQQYNAGDQNANSNASAGALAVAGATATAGAESSAVADAVANANAVNIANVTDIGIGTVNECLNAADGGGSPTDPSDPTDPRDPTDPTDPTDPGHGGNTDDGGRVGTDTNIPDDIIIESIPDGQKVLADTGGPLLLLPVLGLFSLTLGATLLRIFLRR